MKRIIVFIFVLSLCGLAMAQAPKDSVLKKESLAMHVNKMSANRQNLILNSYSYSTSRDLGESIASAAIGAVTDVALTEIVKLITLLGEQKKEWRSMIEKECSYCDDIRCLNDVNDFYSKVSQKGAMDPTDLAFDGVTICDSIYGKEIMRMVCSVDLSDSTKLQNLWKYGTFSLVLDTFIFYPYKGHLPNIGANNIQECLKSKSKRDNDFHFDERGYYNVSIKMNLTSSWINQAVMVMRDVKLGEFNVTVKIDQKKLELLNGDSAYVYWKGKDTTRIVVSGSSFIVPRSYIMTSDTKGSDLWGVGNFKIAAKLTESCGFNFDRKTCKRAEKWLKDYYDILNMQKKSGKRFWEYVETLLLQKTGMVIKTTATKAIGGATEKALGLDQNQGQK